MKTVKDYFDNFYAEVKKYKPGIQILNDGISEELVKAFETKHGFCLPFYYREWLKMNNGGELFAVPAGTELARIQGDDEYENSILYIEDNFAPNKRWHSIPDYLFIIAKECTGNAIGFDLRRTNRNDGVVIRWDHETGEIDEEWKNMAEWLDNEMESGKMLVNYDGSESNFFDFLAE